MRAICVGQFGESSVTALISRLLNVPEAALARKTASGSRAFKRGSPTAGYSLAQLVERCITDHVRAVPELLPHLAGVYGESRCKSL